MLYDITRTVRPATAVWPGDAQYQVDTVLAMDAGTSVNLTALSLSPHTGTHADAYFHYTRAGVHPADMPLSPYLGPARVVTVARRAGPLTSADFAPGALDGVQRLLIKSHVSDLPDDQWPSEFPYLSVALIETLALHGCVLIGLDSPSVDAFDSTDLPCHNAIRNVSMVNLELCLLRDVPDGDYELIALPLKLDLACGSPVRAVLRTI